MITKTLLVSWLPCCYIESFWEGIPLIFLHGWWQSKEAFQKLYSLLEKKSIPFFGIDFPGFWSTPDPSPLWWVQNYADFIVSFLEKKWIEKYILIGHSFGGRIGIVLASRKLSWLHKLILIGSAWILPKISSARKILISGVNLLLWIPGTSSLRPLLRERFSSDDDRNAGSLRAIFRRVIGEDLEPLLGNIICPTLLIWWALDAATPISDWELMQMKIPWSTLRVFDTGTHFVYDEFPEEVLNTVTVFLH